MEVFLAEYGLSTDEGIALMCLAEALLRVPDAETMDALIEDKIAPVGLGPPSGQVGLQPRQRLDLGADADRQGAGRPRAGGIAGHLRAAVKRLGEPVIRTAVARAMKEMGRNFVLGETIDAAMDRADELEAQGLHLQLRHAGRGGAHRSRRAALSPVPIPARSPPSPRAANGNDIRANPGISVKLSALHPRYEVAKRARVMAELVPRVRALAALAKAAGLGFNIDAEEADRLALSLEVIEARAVRPRAGGLGRLRRRGAGLWPPRRAP